MQLKKALELKVLAAPPPDEKMLQKSISEWFARRIAKELSIEQRRRLLKGLKENKDG